MCVLHAADRQQHVASKQRLHDSSGCCAFVSTCCCCLCRCCCKLHSVKLVLHFVHCQWHSLHFLLLVTSPAHFFPPSSGTCHALLWLLVRPSPNSVKVLPADCVCVAQAFPQSICLLRVPECISLCACVCVCVPLNFSLSCCTCAFLCTICATKATFMWLVLPALRQNLPHLTLNGRALPPSPYPCSRHPTLHGFSKSALKFI